VLFVLDIKAPTHGALTAAGVASLIVGALVLFNSPSVPAVQRVSVPLVIIVSLLSGALFFTFVLFAVRAQKTPVRMGMEILPGRIGVVRDPLAPVGTVQLGGELWTAESVDRREALLSGARIEVVRVEGTSSSCAKPASPGTSGRKQVQLRLLIEVGQTVKRSSMPFEQTATG